MGIKQCGVPIADALVEPMPWAVRLGCLALWLADLSEI